MASSYHTMPRDVQLALTEVSQDFDAAFALGDVEQWAGAIGFQRNSDAIAVKFPLPLSAAGYVLRNGDDKMRRLYERSLSMTVEEWVDGVEEKAAVVERAADWIGWNNEPANMAAEALRLPNILVADVLAQNPLLDFYRVEHSGGSTASTLHLFDSAHPYNVLDAAIGDFDNDWQAAQTVQGELLSAQIDNALVRACRKHFRTICGPNGRPLGLRFAGFLVAAGREEEAADAFERDTLIELVRNAAGAENVSGVAMGQRFKGTKIVVADELTGILPSGTTGDGDVLYAFATKASGTTPAPWIVQRGSTPEEIRYDKDSDRYKDTGMIGVKYVLQAAARAALPHAIVRIKLAP